MTSLTTTPEETTWVSDFGPIPFDSLDLASHEYEVRSYWLADFRLKTIGESLGFAAKFDSPEVFSAYLDITGDEGYIFFEIKTNTRPQNISLRYAADRWDAVDGRAAHTKLKNPYSETTIKSRGALTVYHAFLDAELLAKVCEQLEITAETQSKLLARVNFKEKTYSLVASEEAVNDFPPQKPYKTSIIPKSPTGAGKQMNAQEETADTILTTASAEPSLTPTAASGSSPLETATETGEGAPAINVESARAEILAWATADEKKETESAKDEPSIASESPAQSAVESTPAVDAAPVAETPQAVEAAPVVETPQAVAATPVVETPQAVEEAPTAEPQAVEASAPEVAEVPVEPPVEATPAAETSAPLEEVTTPAESPKAEATESSAPVEATKPSEAPAQTVEAAAATPEQTAAATEDASKTEPKKPEVWRTPAEIRAERPAGQSQNAAKTSESGVLGKLAAKSDSGNRDKKDNRDGRENNRDKKDNRESRENFNASQRSNPSQNRTNFAPQTNRSIEAPRPVESTPKYHTYSQSEVDNLIKKSAENVSNSISSKINKQTKLVEDSLKNQDFAFKQALESINKQTEIANDKLDKAVRELTSASNQQKEEYKQAFNKEIEEFKNQMNQKVNQGVKIIDSKLEKLAEVKITSTKQKAIAPKAQAATAASSINKGLIIGIAVVALLALVNIVIMIGAIDRITKLENASPATKATTGTEGEVPIPDLMKDQIKQETTPPATATPAPVQP